jgi:ubiquinone/menaquinone biosynthesis C-methylase UbiE
MDVARQSSDEQRALWNGRAASAWVDTQDLLDHILKPLEDLLLEAMPAGSSGQVLDVGCGTGGTTLAIARRLGTRGRSIGIDISAPMIDHARARVEPEGTPAAFICANAQNHALEPASFDLVVSRIGVMFFDDPVAAFANLRRAAKYGAALRFVAWRSAAENPFMTAAERAAAPLLPNMPARRPDAPGQFSFADPDRVERILQESGWSDIQIRPLDVACTLPESELVRYLTRLGPVGLVLPDADERTRSHVIATVRAAFDPYVHGDEVRFTAGCWMVDAKATAQGTPKEATNA